MKSKITFIVPCLNEKKNILQAIKIINIDYEIIIVDDFSTDNTFDVMKILKKENNNIKIYRNNKNYGLGKTYSMYIKKAKGSHYMLINGDNAENINSIKKIVKHVNKAELIIPYFKNKDKRSWLRINISKLYTLIINIINGENIKYYNGPVLHKLKNLKKIKILSSGFGYQTEIISKLIKLKKSILFIQINNKKRIYGLSKAFRFKNIINIMYTMCVLFLLRLKIINVYKS